MSEKRTPHLDGGAAVVGVGDPIHPRLHHTKNRQIGQVIPVADGNRVHWAATDLLYSFKRELEQAGLIQEADPEVARAMYRAWLGMRIATYFEPGDWPEE